MVTIGVLAFQGAFERHAEKVQLLGCRVKLVRCSKDLLDCDALILPGGESTVMRHHFLTSDFTDSFLHFAKNKPLFGTCAGLILMAHYGILNLSIERNAYGRQIDSFSAYVEVKLGEQKKEVEALFIRAPKITALHSPEIEALANHNSTPIFVREGIHFGASFHPELTNDLSIHHYFIEEVIDASSKKKCG